MRSVPSWQRTTVPLPRCTHRPTMTRPTRCRTSKRAPRPRKTGPVNVTPRVKTTTRRNLTYRMRYQRLKARLSMIHRSVAHPHHRHGPAADTSSRAGSTAGSGTSFGISLDIEQQVSVDFEIVHPRPDRFSSTAPPGNGVRLSSPVLVNDAFGDRSPSVLGEHMALGSIRSRT